MRRQREVRTAAVAHRLRGTGRSAEDHTVYVVHPGALAASSYQRLADALGEGTGLTVLDLGAVSEYSDTAYTGGRADVTVEDLADLLRVEFDVVHDGRPWSLLGWSFGGVVGHELITALPAARRPEQVVLLDSIAPVPAYKQPDDALAADALLTWFAMYLGAKRGRRVLLSPEALAGCDVDRGLDLVLSAALDSGALLPGTPKVGLRKVYQTYVDGLLRNNRLVEPYHPAPAAWPLTLVKAERSLIDGDPALGWESLAAGGLRTLTCQGDHYTMLSSPDAVTTLSALLDPRPAPQAAATEERGSPPRPSQTERVAVNAQQEADLDRRLAREPIAIVGLSALYPKSSNLREFWRNIVEGADCITDVPDGHWSLDEHYDPDPAAPDKTYCRRGGFIPPVAFNPLEFGLPPNTLEVTDVLQLLSLVVARDALADAGADGAWYDANRTGVVLGVTGANQLTQPLAARLQTPVLKEVVRSCGLSDRDAEEIAEKFKLALAPWEENSFPGMLGNVVAGRIANRLDLGGTNATVDAACASSLAAAKLAVSELLEHRADTMLTGGCDAENTILMYLCFSKTPAFSKAGVIRPFDTAADGTLIGEGIGMLALRRLADAERDGNRIYAVIRGIGSSSDGRFKSIYAPRKEGQVVALKRAYEDADCQPDTVELFEAHGTGTAVGDATELSALASVVGEGTGAARFAAIGSVKSQIGHTKAAAGAAGMIKLALALHGKVLPPTINVDQPSSAVEFDGSPFYVNTQSRPWVRNPDRPHRRAAISAFGFGGTNFHFVLEEHAGVDDARLFPAARPYVWHAPDVTALAALLESDAAPATGGIPPGHARVGFAARTPDQLAELRALAAQEVRARVDAESWSHPKGVHFRRRSVAGAKVGALFAGQGSQYVGLGATALMALPPVLDAFDRANACFAGAEPLSTVAFPPPAFDDATRGIQELALRRTEYAQPAIGALSAGQFRYLRELGFAADGYLGHSFGELTALWAAGALDDDSFFALARARGAAMAPAEGGEDSGAMAAVSAPEATVAEFIAADPSLLICNRNTPGQIVVGGATAAVDTLVAACAAAGVRATRLPVSAAFHTPFVAHASEAFGAAVAAVDVGEPQRPVYANTPDASYGPDVAENRRVLAEQLVNPVNFADRVEQMYADGFRVFVEFGPKGVLTRLVREILGDREHICVQLDQGPGRDGDLALRQGVAQLAVVGLPLALTDRYSIAEPAPVPAKGMNVQLNGINYVSDARRAAYRDAIENGYRVAAGTEPLPDAVTTADAAPNDAPVRQLSAAPTESDSTTLEVGPVRSEYEPSETRETTALPAIAAAHLALHDDYLAGQLRTAERLTGLLERASTSQDLDSIASSITAVKEHGLAISRTHLRANEILRDLAELELGVQHREQNPAETGQRDIVVGEPAGEGPAPTPAGGTPPAPAAIDTAPLTVIPDALPPAQPVADTAIPIPVRVVPPVAAAAPVAPAPVAAAPVAPAPVAAGPVVSASVAAPGVEAAVVEAALLEVVAAKTGYPAEMLEPGMDVEADLGIDSIKRMEIMGELQERFPAGVEVGPERLAELRTLGDIVAFMVESAAPAAAPGAPTASTVTAGAARFPELSTPPTEIDHPGIGRAQAALLRLPEPDQLVGAYPTGAGVLVLDDGSDLVPAVVSALDAGGWRVEALRLPGARERSLGVRTWAPASRDEPALAGYIDAVLAKGAISACVAVAAETGLDWPEAVDRLRYLLLVAKRVVAPLTASAETGRAAFVTVTRLDGRFGLGGVNADLIPHGGVAGLVKTLAVEAPELFCRAVDVAAGLPPAQVARLVLTELADSAPEPVQVGHDGRYRVGLTLDAAGGQDGSSVAPLTPADVLVVTGGGRGITAACVVDLARTYRCGFVLLGRTSLTPDPKWALPVEGGAAPLKAAAAAYLTSQGDRPTPKDVERLYRDVVGSREIRATLDAVRAAGASAEYLAVDITDASATAVCLAPYADRVTGLVHGAGVLADQLIAKKSAADIDRVFAPKLAGLRSVVAALRADELRHIVLFSSVAGFFGNRGQSDYAMANEVLNAWASAWKRRHPTVHVTSLNWGAWDSGMVSPQVKKVFEERGITLIPVATGARLFTAQFAGGRASDVVTVLGPTTPLSERQRVLPAAPVVLERDLAGLAADPVVAEHILGGVPVLPATVALGWAVAAAERLTGGTVKRVQGFAVHKGVVFDGSERRRFELEARPDGDTALTVAIRSVGADGKARPHYAVTVSTLAPPPGPMLTDLPVPGTGEDAAGLYADGTLFHGPALRGVRRVLAAAGTRLVLQCSLAAFRPAEGAFDGQVYSPVTADLLLQAALVWVRRFTGAAGLPTAVAGGDLYEALPDGGDFLVVVEPAAAGPAGAGTALDVTACTPDGRVLTRLTGVSVVSTPNLAEKFSAGATTSA